MSLKHGCTDESFSTKDPFLQLNKELKRKQQRSNAEEKNCVVCLGPILASCIRPCGHNDVCMSCYLMEKTVLGQNFCPLCKHVPDKTILTTKVNASFTDFEQSNMTLCRQPMCFIEKAETEILACLNQLFTFKCPFKSCEKIFQSLVELKYHLVVTHERNYCETCLRDRKVFLHEQKLFTNNELLIHRKEWDGGVEEQTRAFESKLNQQEKKELEKTKNSANPKLPSIGHPLCEFCETEHYNNDYLYKHLNKTHFRCVICLGKDINNWDYFETGETLRSHYLYEHFLCTFDSCEAKEVVFNSKKELIEHKLNVHGNKLSKKEKTELSNSLSKSRASSNRRSGESNVLKKKSNDSIPRQSVLKSNNRKSPHIILQNRGKKMTKAIIFSKEEFPELPVDNSFHTNVLPCGKNPEENFPKRDVGKTNETQKLQIVGPKPNEVSVVSQNPKNLSVLSEFSQSESLIITKRKQNEKERESREKDKVQKEKEIKLAQAEERKKQEEAKTTRLMQEIEGKMKEIERKMQIIVENRSKEKEFQLQQDEIIKTKLVQQDKPKSSQKIEQKDKQKQQNKPKPLNIKRKDQQIQQDKPSKNVEQKDQQIQQNKPLQKTELVLQDKPQPSQKSEQKNQLVQQNKPQPSQKTELVLQDKPQPPLNIKRKGQQIQQEKPQPSKNIEQKDQQNQQNKPSQKTELAQQDKPKSSQNIKLKGQQIQQEKPQPSKNIEQKDQQIQQDKPSQNIEKTNQQIQQNKHKPLNIKRKGQQIQHNNIQTPSNTREEIDIELSCKPSLEENNKEKQVQSANANLPTHHLVIRRKEKHEEEELRQNSRERKTQPLL